ncbi:MAG: uberolysin/carnocyclin family circular bacteriocin [Lachnospiraceae bacterium]|nr:uberolysin/carnocyclin family circular bacteriocin [Lachnospiraceae bacterium]MDD6448703.1 uberolysin/carnocyclin family circular bacteriocin [Lachnospiraceae bacterium]MDD6451922.1 uberolysin/carnocyclin family circular bacteriocin [Lachnospiraceae bacterium]MDD6578636.1 uberolysin/carnocyclin family circular bacteriocin [Lachnospiraceae bacterium]
MNVAGFLGISSGAAQKICDAINKFGYAFIACSFIAMCLSGGTLSSLLSSADYVCGVVLSFYRRHLAFQAVVW